MPNETLEKIAEFFIEHKSPLTAQVIQSAIRNQEVSDQAILQLTERVRDLEQGNRELNQIIEDLTTRDCYHCDHMVENPDPQEGIVHHCTLLNKPCTFLKYQCGHFREAKEG
jgi:hypothetical protein